MKIPRVTPFLLVVLTGIDFSQQAFAVVNIDYVSVGNAGNAANFSPGYGSYGAVPYVYQIGKYEVTNAQYSEFLNAKAGTDSHSLYNASMSSYGITQTGSSGNYVYNVTGALANRPVVYVSWFDAARFANWLLNGQGSSDTESGAYNLNGATDGVFFANAGVSIHLPSANEWYKAAYYDPAKDGTGGYWMFPNQSDTITTVDANYLGAASTNIGSFGDDASHYGTFDQGGNVGEWNDELYFSAPRGMRGGSYSDNVDYLRSSPNTLDITYRYPTVEQANIGFRVAGTVPEPTSHVLTILTAGLVLTRRKRI